MVKRLHDAGIEVDPRRRLQPHRRGKRARPDVVVSRHRQQVVLPARPTTRATTRTTTGCGNTLEPAPSARAEDGDRLAALLGERDARRRLPLRSRDDAGAHERERLQHPEQLLQVAQTRPGAFARQADRRAVGCRATAATRSAIFPPAGRSGTTGIATPCAAFGAATAAMPRVGLAARPVRATSSTGTAGARARASTSSPRTTASRWPTSSRTTASTTRRTSKTTATAPTRTQLELRSGGPTDDPGILALRERQKRNFLATLLLSQGLPMLLAGDEFGHTQGGNNNAYCQDNDLGWLDRAHMSDDERDLFAFVRR